MAAVAKPTPGFCLKALCRDGTTKVFINVCGHASVGLPQTRSQQPIPGWEFVDAHGIDNLMIPIAVGDVKELVAGAVGVAGGRKLVVDVVVHDALIERCTPSYHRVEHMVGRLSALAVQWVQQETGLVVVPSSVHRLQNVRYKAAAAAGAAPSPADMARRVAEAMAELAKSDAQTRGGAESGSTATAAESAGTAAPEAESSPALPADLLVKPGGAAKGSGGKPLIVELATDGKPTGALRRGFLNAAKGSLYGDGGTREGAPPPDDARSDPLQGVPEALRGKCQIVDMRDPAEQRHRPLQQRGAAQTSVPVAPNVDFMQDLQALAEGGRGRAERDDVGHTHIAPGILGGASDPAPPVRRSEDVLGAERARSPPRPAPPTPPGATHIAVEDATPPVAEEQQQRQQPSHFLAEVTTDGRDVVVFLRPNRANGATATAADLDLEVTERELVCDAGRLRVALPRSVDCDRASAKLSKKTGILTVRVPQLP